RCGVVHGLGRGHPARGAREGRRRCARGRQPARSGGARGRPPSDARRRLWRPPARRCERTPRHRLQHATDGPRIRGCARDRRSRRPLRAPSLRIPRALAWLLLVMALLTAGLLRQFHDLTPTSPFLNPSIGSLLFASVVFLFLVAIRERQIRAASRDGVRLGSMTPFLLMLLVEKWFSATAYGPLFTWIAPDDLDSAT